MKELLAILLLVVVVGMIYNKISKDSKYTTASSTINDKSYTVRKLPDKQAAANKLATISMSLSKLVKHVTQDKSLDRYKGIHQLARKFNPNNLTENAPGGKYTAYSVNKGEQLSLCLRNVEDNTFIDNNTIYFVAIHELAHIMTDEIGHTPKFWSNMKYLLEKAHEIGIYTPVDYSISPVNYCGKEVKTTPYEFR